MCPDTAAGFVSGSLCLLQVNWGGWRGIRTVIAEGGTSPDPDCVIKCSFNIIPDVIQGGIHTGRFPLLVDLVYSWCGGSQPCWFVYSLPVGLGKPSEKGICPWRGINAGCQTSFSCLIKEQCVGDCPFFNPNFPSLGRETPRYSGPSLYFKGN